MLGLKLIHVSKRCHKGKNKDEEYKYVYFDASIQYLTLPP